MKSLTIRLTIYRQTRWIGFWIASTGFAGSRTQRCLFACPAVTVYAVFEKYNSVKPYLITNSPPPDRERLQSREEHKIFEDAIRCILCACCTASCPINQAKETEAYIGPAALVRAFRYLFDSRDEGAEDRISLLDNKDGAWGCQTKWWCTKVCPKEIPVTRQIARIKKLIIENKKGKQ